MNLHPSQELFLIGLSVYIAIRSVYQMRAGSREKTVNRSNGRDRILIAKLSDTMKTWGGTSLEPGFTEFTAEEVALRRARHVE